VFQLLWFWLFSSQTKICERMTPLQLVSYSSDMVIWICCSCMASTVWLKSFIWKTTPSRKISKFWLHLWQVWSEEGGWSNTVSLVSHAQESKENKTFIALWTLGLISPLFHWDWFSNLGVQEMHVHSERCTKYGLNEDFFLITFLRHCLIYSIDCRVGSWEMWMSWSQFYNVG